jgi:hypothetical protein
MFDFIISIVFLLNLVWYIISDYRGKKLDAIQHLCVAILMSLTLLSSKADVIIKEIQAQHQPVEKVDGAK